MLYEAMFVDCVIINKRTVMDESGTFNYKWEEGVPFKAAILKNQTLEADIAEKDGFTELYTVSTYRETPLDVNDVFRRVTDGQVFRVTSKTKDNTSPVFSSINLGQVKAEKWVLP